MLRMPDGLPNVCVLCLQRTVRNGKHRPIRYYSNISVLPLIVIFHFHALLNLTDMPTFSTTEICDVFTLCGQILTVGRPVFGT
jgi:hypothetical protein